MSKSQGGTYALTCTLLLVPMASGNEKSPYNHCYMCVESMYKWSAPYRFCGSWWNWKYLCTHSTGGSGFLLVVGEVAFYGCWM